MFNKKRLRQFILEAIAANSGVNPDMVIDAIDGKRKIIIQYLSNGEDRWKGPRIVNIYAYGISKGGNPVFRGFQQYGDSRKRIYKGWKLFRLDRILSWKDSGQTFEVPQSFGAYGAFNPNGDKTMATVLHILKIESEPTHTPSQNTYNASKFKTSTEKGLERLKQQLDNPIYLKDIAKNPQRFEPKKKTSATPYNQLKGKEREKYIAWKQREAENEPINKVSDEFFKEYEKRVGRQQAERDKRALGISGEITKEKLSNAQGAVDRMKKYHKGSANDFIRSISDEVFKRIIDNFSKKETENNE